MYVVSIGAGINIANHGCLLITILPHIKKHKLPNKYSSQYLALAWSLCFIYGKNVFWEWGGWGHMTLLMICLHSTFSKGVRFYLPCIWLYERRVSWTKDFMSATQTKHLVKKKYFQVVSHNENTPLITLVLHTKKSKGHLNFSLCGNQTALL